jgi:hypothetical protein
MALAGSEGSTRADSASPVCSTRASSASGPRDAWPADPSHVELKRIVKLEKVHIAVLAVPPAAGQSVLDQVIAAGVRAILNFVPVRLRVPNDVELVTVDLKIQMEGLAYHLTQIDSFLAGGERKKGARAARTETARAHD